MGAWIIRSRSMDSWSVEVSWVTYLRRELIALVGIFHHHAVVGELNHLVARLDVLALFHGLLY